MAESNSCHGDIVRNSTLLKKNMKKTPNIVALAGSCVARGGLGTEALPRNTTAHNFILDECADVILLLCM